MQGQGRVLSAFLILIGLCSLSTPSFAQDVIPIPQIDQAIVVDGVLSEDHWQQGRHLTIDYETDPGENTPAPVKTDVWIYSDGVTIYVGYHAHDPEPEKIRAWLRDRDQAWSHDLVGIKFDTFNDKRRAFQFFATALGVQMDSTQDDITDQDDDSWDAIWYSAGTIQDDGYQVEMAIPLSALRFPDQPIQEWGIELLRFWPRDVRHRLASGPVDRDIECLICQFPVMRGLEDARPGSNLEITPTLTVVASEHRDPPGNLEWDSEVDVEPGVDISWGLSPNMTLNATINPDFSQVETDDAQLDVNTTFTLFFPEKRPFFLEGADYFNTPWNVVHTRNIVDPDIGLKLTGKSGPHTHGVFVAADTTTSFLIPGPLSSDVANLDEDSNNVALRYRYDIGDNTSVGFIGTSRDSDSYHNRVAGFDLNSTLGDVHKFRAQWLYSDSEYPQTLVEEHDLTGPSLDGQAYRLSYDMDSRDWLFRLAYITIDPEFRADLGFFTRADITRKLIGGARRWYPTDNFFTYVELYSDYDRTEDHNGLLLEEEWEAWLNLNGGLQSSFSVGYNTRERFWDGQLFDEHFIALEGNFRPRRGVKLGLDTQFGEQIDFANSRAADFVRLRPEVSFDIGRGIELKIEHIYQKLSIPQGDIFTVNLSDIRLSYQMSLRSRLRLAVGLFDIDRNQALFVDEVDVSERSITTQLVYSYKINPRTALFAGYSDAGFEDDLVPSFTRTDRSVFLKLGYAFAR